jgi:hypothetical protein
MPHPIASGKREQPDPSSDDILLACLHDDGVSCGEKRFDGRRANYRTAERTLKRYVGKERAHARLRAKT